MPGPDILEFKPPRQRHANDNWPSQQAGSVGGQQRPATRPVLIMLGLLSLTTGSCLLGIGAVEALLR
jgi:hypothetical protein